MLVFFTILLLGTAAIQARPDLTIGEVEEDIFGAVGSQAAPQTSPGPANNTPIPNVEKVGRNGFQQFSELNI